MEVENMTTFEEIFKRASYKLENEKYIDYSEEELKEDFTELLEEAIGRFDQCYDKNRIVDYDMEIISPALTIKELKITTDLMVSSCTQRSISKIVSFSDGIQLTTSDYKTFSQANMLQQKQEAYKSLKSDIETQMLEYGSQKAISFLNKRVGVNNELAK